ncbi:MAG: hypothetical protein Q9159_006471 [Coniocarpon cinnabarinum]
MDESWTADFVSSKGNEYFCDIDEEYLTDRFNLTNLNTEVQYYQYALDLVTDVFDLDCDEETREQIEKSARHLYGLVHARYIVTTRGLQKMLEKYKKGEFGKCPRVFCEGQPLLPMGQHDVANMSPVKLYCPRCEDLYNPKSSRHASIDGAYFGTSFHGILFQVYPQLQPPKTQRRHEPKIYGFKVHAAAALARWQEEKRDHMKSELVQQGLDTGFEREDEEEMGDGDSQGDEVAAEDGIDDMFEGTRTPQTARVARLGLDEEVMPFMEDQQESPTFGGSLADDLFNDPQSALPGPDQLSSSYISTIYKVDRLAVSGSSHARLIDSDRDKDA